MAHFLGTIRLMCFRDCWRRMIGLIILIVLRIPPWCLNDCIETGLKPTSQDCPPSCRYNKFCTECIKYEFRNPLHCVEHGPVFALFGEFCSVLLWYVSVEDVTTAVRQLPDKYCVSDPIPTSLLKDNIHVLAPFLTFLFNRSLSLGSVPVILKAAYITPRLKKPDLDTLDVKSYRPISNLPVLSKVLERLVVV